MDAVILAAHGALLASMAASRVANAFGVNRRAASFTSATIVLASIVSGRFGRPPGLPETPGLKLVDRSPPRAIASLRLFYCLFIDRCVHTPIQGNHPRECGGASGPQPAQNIHYVKRRLVSRQINERDAGDL